MICRRKFLLSVAGVIVLPRGLLAKSTNADLSGWNHFHSEMSQLARANAEGTISQRQMARQGLLLLQRLNVESADFMNAVENAFETGNRFWLWQRMVKETGLNGGILNIDKSHVVQLHDHPGATGMLKIISGEVEIWQFDQNKTYRDNASRQVELRRTSRKVLRPGDVGVLHPDYGNIHALRSITDECRMLDFFIPPYRVSERNWYEPLKENWFDEERISCRRIPQHEFAMI